MIIKVIWFLLLLVMILLSFVASSDLIIKTIYEHKNKTFYNTLLIDRNENNKEIVFKHKNQFGWIKLWKISFKQGIQIFDVIYLGEKDLGEPEFHKECFVLDHSPSKSSLSSFERFTELKQHDLQKAFQSVDLKMEKEKHVFDKIIPKEHVYQFGSFVSSTCSSANNIYTTHEAVLNIAASLQDDNLLKVVKRQTLLSHDQFPLCLNSDNGWTIYCLCKTSVEIDWFLCRNCMDANCKESRCSKIFDMIYLAENKDVCFSKLADVL